MQKRKNDVKARSTLLLSLPDEHQLRFSKYKTVQELWAAILKPLVVIVSQLELMDIGIKQDDLNQNFLTSLAPERLMHTIVWRNKSDLDTNMAFSAKHSSGNEEVNTASVSTASTNISPASANIRAASISQDIACTYIASQSNGSLIKFEDINQIDEDDMEEMDIKWNMTLLSMRADIF
nr:hypothetical protein [Tanacetum cinerariifolium]